MARIPLTRDTYRDLDTVLAKLKDHDVSLDQLDPVSDGTVLDGIYNVAGFGLVGDDSTDNRAALQTLVDMVAAGGGGTIYFPPGVYRFQPRPGVGWSAIGFVRMIGTGYKNIRFTGAGNKSVLKMVGPNTSGDCYLFWVANGASHITFDHLKMIQGACYPMVEHMHLINVYGTADAGATGPQVSHHVTVYACDFGYVNGDAVHTGGNLNYGCTDILVDGCYFNLREHPADDASNVNGGRSCIGVQSNANRQIFTRNYMTGVDDQLIDYEPTGQENLDSIIAHNIFVMDTGLSPPAFTGVNGGFAVTLAGNSVSFPNTRCIFTDNTVIEGRIGFINVTDLVVSRNTIYCDTLGNAEGAIQSLRVGRRLEISHNVITVPESSGAPPITVAGDTLGNPSEVLVHGNVVQWASDQAACLITDGANVVVSSNVLKANRVAAYGGARPAINLALNPTTTGFNRGVAITGNVIETTGATLGSAIAIDSTSLSPKGEISITGNSGRGFTNGVQLQGTQVAANPAVVVGNNLQATTSALALANGQFAIVSGNGGPVSPGTYVSGSNADPNTLSALDGVPIGSQYVVRAAGATKKLWVKDAAGASGWVAVY